MKIKNAMFLSAVLFFAMILFFVLLTLRNNINPTSYGTEFLIGMSQCNKAEPYRAKMDEDIQAAARAHENVKVVFTDARQSNEKQINDIQYLMDIGIDLLIVSPNETEPLNEIISRVHESIPVIVLDRKVSTDNFTLFIGADNFSIGMQAGNYVSSQFGNEKVNIVEIRGLLGSTSTDERSQGFYEAIRKKNNMTIVKKITGDWLRDVAEDRVEGYLLSDGNNEAINVIYAHNDPMAHGAYNALTKLGMHADCIVGIDGLAGFSGGQDLVQLNILDVTFEYPTGGFEAIEYALRILKGENFSSKTIQLDTRMIK